MIVLCFGMQEDDGIKHINAKCCVFALIVNLLTMVCSRFRPHNVVENNNVKILVSTLTSSVTRLH